MPEQEIINELMHSDIKVQIVNTNKAGLPGYATSGSAGMDICANLKGASTKIFPGGRQLIHTGVYVAIPRGYEIQVRPRSGLALKKGLTVLNTPGTIDADFRGEIGVILINLSQDPQVITDGERIAQIVLKKVENIIWEEVDALPETQRGAGGFGSTGNWKTKLSPIIGKCQQSEIYSSKG